MEMEVSELYEGTIIIQSGGTNCFILYNENPEEAIATYGLSVK